MDALFFLAYHRHARLPRRGPRTENSGQHASERKQSLSRRKGDDKHTGSAFDERARVLSISPR